MFNEKPQNEFKIHDEEDKKCYFYDITPYIQYMIGDFVKEADIHLGYIYKEDTDFEQKMYLEKFKTKACEIDNKFKVIKRVEVENNEIIRITFTNGKRIEISALDYGYIRES